MHRARALLRRPVVSNTLLVLALLASAPLLLTGCGAVVAPAESASLLGLVNQARGTPRSCGTTPYAAAPALSLDARLTRAAQLHSQDMQHSATMSHTGSDGSTVGDRATAQGYTWARIGEDIAWGFSTPGSVIQAWLASPGHCANIMDPKFRDLGTGVAGTYWTLDFGTPR
jgi:uncharacterized protein YkwD